MVSEKQLSEILQWDEAEIEEALEDGRNEEELKSLLGPAGFREAIQLAGLERKRVGRKRPRVFIVPGVVGSKLGNAERLLDRLRLLIWLNPLRIREKGLNDLALNSGKGIRTFGVFQSTYLLLHLHLRKEGYGVRNFAYDWRLPISEAAETLAKALKDEADREIYIVAHSMGGLLVREALAKSEDRFPQVQRIITLGTPHGGSFSPTPLLQGEHRHLKMAANLADDDPHRIAEDVFATMPGFYELLPDAALFENHLFDPNLWPENGPAVDPDLLTHGRRSHQRRPETDHRFRAIIGYGRQTISGAIAGSEEFQYESTHDGDGAVLLPSAEIDTVASWYTTTEHGQLPNSKRVRRAIIDIFENDTTDQLGREPVRKNDTFPHQIKRVRSSFDPTSDIDASQLREMFSDFGAAYVDDDDDLLPQSSPGSPTSGPPKSDLPTITAYGPGSETRHFELKLFGGSILDAPVRVVAAGVIDGVAPGGAASAIDAALGGKFSKLRDANGIDARQGGLTIATATRAPIRADMAFLVGLGDLSRINEDGLTAAMRALCRRLIIDRLDDCAVVLFGANSGMSIEACMRGVVRGITSALEEWDSEALLRNITICEVNPSRFDEMVAATDTALRGLDLKRTIQIRKVPVRQFEAISEMRSRELQKQPKQWDLVHLNVDVFASQHTKRFNYTVLAGAGAASTTGASIDITHDRFERLLDDISGNGAFSSLDDARDFGGEMRKVLLPPEILQSLEENLGDKRLVVVHKQEGSRVPWELLMLPNRSFPALRGGLSRVYSSAFVKTPTKWKGSSGRKKMRILIISNPTADLDGAAAETKALTEMLAARRDVEYVILEEGEATKAKIIELMGSGATLDEPGFDIVHYAGHADHDELQAENGGLIAANYEIITGHDIQNLPVIPPLVFFNACQSARVRGEPPKKLVPKRVLERSVSLAEAFLEGGVRSFVGTYWPVGDKPAELFADTFYKALFDGETLGDALVRSRNVVHDDGDADWADYMHFGDFEYSL